jgi:hypothetical protein
MVSISAFVYLSRGLCADPHFEARGLACWAAASRWATRGKTVVVHSTLGMLPSDLEGMRGQGWLAKMAGRMERPFSGLRRGASLFSVITMSWLSWEVDSFPVVLQYGVGEAGGEGVTSSRKGGIGVGNVGLASDGVYGTIGWMSAFIPGSTAIARTGIDVIPHSIEGGVIIMLSISFPARGSEGGLVSLLGW